MSRPHKVVVTDFITDALAPERSVLGDIADVVALNATDEKELVGKVEDAGALMVYHSILRLSGATIDRLSGCKVITRCGVGYDNVELAAAQRRGIPVCNVPDYGTEEVADSAIGMMLTLTRGIHVLNSRLRDSREEWHYTHAAPLSWPTPGCGSRWPRRKPPSKVLGINYIFWSLTRKFARCDLVKN